MPTSWSGSFGRWDARTPGDLGDTQPLPRPAPPTRHVGADPVTNGHLSSLRAHLADERAREADARPSRTTDDELDRAIERVTRADAALAEGQVDVAAREMAELAYVAGDSWPHSGLGAEILRASQALERLTGRP